MTISSNHLKEVVSRFNDLRAYVSVYGLDFSAKRTADRYGFYYDTLLPNYDPASAKTKTKSRSDQGEPSGFPGPDKKPKAHRPVGLYANRNKSETKLVVVNDGYSPCVSCMSRLCSGNNCNKCEFVNAMAISDGNVFEPPAKVVKGYREPSLMERTSLGGMPVVKPRAQYPTPAGPLLQYTFGADYEQDQEWIQSQREDPTNLGNFYEGQKHAYFITNRGLELSGRERMFSTSCFNPTEGPTVRWGAK